jgi:hypothetical protein
MPYVPEPHKRQLFLARLMLTLVLIGWVGSTGTASLESHASRAQSYGVRQVTEGQHPESIEGQRPEPAEERLSQLPIGMMVHPPALDYFNANARADDIGAVLVVSTGLLPRISSGERLVMSPSVELAEERAAEFVADTEYFGYNIEHWPDTPASEQWSPGTAGAAAAEFARRHNLGYVVGPDLQFTEDFGAELAGPADIYVIQGQRIQENIPFFTTTVTNFAQNARRGNPDVLVWVQVSASFGTPEQTLEALQAVVDEIDGIWIHYNQNAQSFGALQELVQLLRGPNPAPAAATATAVPPTATSMAAYPAPTLVVRLTQTPTTTPETTQPSSTASPALPLEPTGPVPDPPTQSPAAPWLPIAGAAIIVLAAGLVGIGFIAGSLWSRQR